MFTLVFVLMVTSFKEGYEDLRRHYSDVEENCQNIIVVTFDAQGRPIETVKPSREIITGDIVKLQGRTVVPADMIVFFTSNYADNNQCYVETMNIDGETNLKLREAPAAIKLLIKPTDAAEATPSMFGGFLEYESPSRNIHVFIGALHLSTGADPIPLDTANLLLRSSVFASTDWCYCVVVYTGQDTKVQLNTISSVSKSSRLESSANLAVMLIFTAQVAQLNLTSDLHARLNAGFTYRCALFLRQSSRCIVSATTNSTCFRTYTPFQQRIVPIYPCGLKDGTYCLILFFPEPVTT